MGDKEEDVPGASYVNGTFRIKGYEAGNRDLVKATVTGIKADDIIAAILGTDADKKGKEVPLTFQHILSMLTFTFTNETDEPIEVADIRFTVINKGDFSNDSWTGVNDDNSTERKLHAETPLTVSGGTTATSDAAFIIPQKNANVTVTFTVNIRETTDGGGSLVFSRRYTSTLATETDEWFIGNRYNYTATIPQDVMDGAAITLNVSVKSWETEDASVSWGGKDEDGESTTNNP